MLDVPGLLWRPYVPPLSDALQNSRQNKKESTEQRMMPHVLDVVPLLRGPGLPPVKEALLERSSVRYKQHADHRG